jgi:hypothetical protein
MPRAVSSVLLCVLLVLALTVPPAFAGREAHPARSAPKAAVTTSPASWTWSALQRLFGSSGAEMDPDGKPKSASTTPGAHTIQPPTTTDLGGMMDPDG